MSLVGKMFARRREALDMTQYGLAVRCGIPPHRISKIENGGNSTMKTVFAIAKALGIENIPVE